jgi:hypothetical protein
MPPDAMIENPSVDGITRLQSGQTRAVSEAEKQQIARDFESILIASFLNDVKNNMGKWGFDEEGVSTQIKGMFGLFLGRALADEGGFGFYKDIYKLLQSNEQINQTSTLMDVVL